MWWVTIWYKAKDNYRPISLLSAISKILKKNNPYKHNFLLTQEVLNKSQYSFRKHHSTNHAVHEFLDNVTTSIDNKINTIVIFLDLSKAFDTIDHTILLHKFEWYGVRGKALYWFKSYLHNYKQYVQYNNAESDTLTVPCGVPQGSVLGPLLLIIYTNDLPNSLLNCKMMTQLYFALLLIYNCFTVTLTMILKI